MSENTNNNNTNASKRICTVLINMSIMQNKIARYPFSFPK